MEKIGETLRSTLNTLAAAAPDGIVKQAAPDWGDRYGRRVESYRLPYKKAECQQWAQQVMRDGQQLLAAIDGAAAPPLG